LEGTAQQITTNHKIRSWLEFQTTEFESHKITSGIFKRSTKIISTNRKSPPPFLRAYIFPGFVVQTVHQLLGAIEDLLELGITWMENSGGKVIFFRNLPKNGNDLENKNVEKQVKNTSNHAIHEFSVGFVGHIRTSLDTNELAINRLVCKSPQLS